MPPYRQTTTSYQAIGKHREPWTPSTKQIPWRGLGALLISLLAIAASVGLLVGSDNQPISTWRFQPTVYLSIASTIANITLHYAFAEGVIAFWWKTALRGSTVGELHRIYDHGNNIWPALTAGRRVNLVTFASILVALTPINGPLLQRASKVSVADISSTPVLSVLMASVVPYGYSGYISGRTESLAMLTRDFTPVVQQWTTQNPISITDTGCKGTCHSFVRGAGFAVNCTSHTVSFNMTSVWANVSGEYTWVYQAGAEYFAIELEYVPSASYVLNLGVQYKNTTKCVGDIQVHNCTLRPATVEYPVTINSDRTISLAAGTTIFDDKLVGITQGQEVAGVGGVSRFGGVYYAMDSRFRASVYMSEDPVYNEITQATGAAASQYAVIPADWNVTNQNEPSNNCHLSYANPLDDIIQSARDLMFRVAVAAPTTNRTLAHDSVHRVSARQTLSEPRYQSSYLFLGLALLVTLVPICVVSTTYHGYWILGRRHLTLSPVETAKAFDAPMLQTDDSNATLHKVIADIGFTPVQYGAVRSYVDTTTPSSSLRRKDGDEYPPHNTPTGSMTAPDGPPSTRLEMNHPRHVVRPRDGWVFSA